MKIISLLENTAADPCLGAEHGLSLYIEACGRKILMDTGETDLFAANAETLGVDLSQVDLAVLSHGHYDHGGGLQRFMEINDKAKIYVSQFAFDEYRDAKDKYIGIDPTLRDNDRFVMVGEELSLGEGLTLYACNDREKTVDMGSCGLTMVRDGVTSPDDFRHEQYLLIEENGKRVLISGCSHKGIVNIMHWFAPDVLVGGFHFFPLPLDDTLVGYARALAEFPAEYYTCHCTGEAQYAFMQPHMPRLHYLAGGQKIEFS